MKRLLSFVLSFVMVVGLFPAPALAEVVEELDAGAQPQEQVEPAEGLGEDASEDEETPETSEPEQEPVEDAQPDSTMQIQSVEAEAAEISIVDASTGQKVTSLRTAHAYKVAGLEAGAANDGTLLIFTRVGDNKAFYPVMNARDGGYYLDGLYQREDISDGYGGYGGASMAIPTGSYTVSFGVVGHGGVAATDTYYVQSDGNLKILSDGELNTDNSMFLSSLSIWPYKTDANSEDEYDKYDTFEGETQSFNATDPLHIRARLEGTFARNDRDLSNELDVSLARVELYPSAYTLNQIKTALAAHSGEAQNYMPTLSNFDPNKCVVAWDAASSPALSNRGSYVESNGDLDAWIIDNFSFAGAAIDTGDYHPVLVMSVNDKKGTAYECRYVYDPVHITAASFTVADPTISTRVLSQAMVGKSYTASLAGRRGNLSSSTLTWSVESESLPAGLILSADGTISGKPTKAGTWTFTVKLTETLGETTRTATQELTIEVSDDIRLGTIEYPKTYWAALPNMLNLSCPINVDLVANGYGASLAYYTVSYRYLDGTTGETETQATIGAHAITASPAIAGAFNQKNPVVAIESVKLALMVKPSADANPEYTLSTSTKTSDLVLGGYARFSALRYEDEAGVVHGLSEEWTNVKQARIRLWPVDSTGKATGTVQEKRIYDTVARSDEFGAFYNLPAGTYRFTVEGAVGDYMTDDPTTWVDIASDASAGAVYGGVSKEGSQEEAEWTDEANRYGSVVSARKIAGTSPAQFELVVEPSRISEVSMDYATNDISHYTANVSFADEEAAYNAAYQIEWRGKRGDKDVLIARGETANIPSGTYTNLTVTATPLGSTAALNDAVTKDVDSETKTYYLVIPRKQTLSVSGTVRCTNGWKPDASKGEGWGSIEVLRPCEGYYTSELVWLDVPAAGSTAASATFTVDSITPGTKLVYTPPTTSGCGSVAYEVSTGQMTNVTGVSLLAPYATGTITFEPGSLKYVTADGYGTAADDAEAVRTSTFDLEDPLVSVQVYEKGYSSGFEHRVPSYIADGTHLMIQDTASNLTEGKQYDLIFTHLEYASSPFGGYSNGTIESVTQAVPVTLGADGKASFGKDSITLRSHGRVVVPYANNLGRESDVLYLFDSAGKIAASGFSWTIGSFGTDGTFSTSFLPAGEYTLYAVGVSSAPSYLAWDTSLTADELETYVLGAGSQPDTTKLTKTRLTIEANKVTQLGSTFPFPGQALQGYTNFVDLKHSNVGVSEDYAGFLTVSVDAALAANTLDFDASQGDEVWLQLDTNQGNIDQGGATNYVHVQSLSVNGKRVDYTRWTGVDLFGGTSAMGGGSLKINLSQLGMGTNASFPVNVTLTIPCTNPMATNVCARLLVKKKQTDETFEDHMALVGSFSEQHGDITIEAPTVAPQRTFTVHGNTQADATVHVLLAGMRVATTKADRYGYWSAEVSLPTSASSGAIFSLQAQAEWVSNDTSHTPSSAVVTTTYSEERGAIKRIWMLWQDEPNGPYNYTLVYNNGEMPAQYQSFYRGWDERKHQGEAQPLFTWMVEFANANAVKNVRVMVPRDSGDLELTTSSNADVVDGWWPEGAKTYKKNTGGAYQAFTYVPYDYYALVQQQMKEGNTFVATPTYFGYAPLSIYVDYDEVQKESAATTPQSEPYTGFTNLSDTAGKRNVARLVWATNEKNDRMKIVTRTESGSNASYTLVDAEAYAATLTSSANVDQWLLLSNDGKLTGAAGKQWLPVHHTMKASNGADGYKALVTGAKDARNSYRSFVNGLDLDKDFNETTGAYMGSKARPTYQNETLVSIATSEDAEDKGLVYFVWTRDSSGNAHLQSMHRYAIEGKAGKYVYELVDMTYRKLTVTRWDEGNNQTTERTYELAYEVLSDPSTKTANVEFNDLLDLWGTVLSMVNEGVEETVTANAYNDLVGYEHPTSYGSLTMLGWNWVETGTPALDYTIGAVVNGAGTSLTWAKETFVDGYNRHQEYEILRQYLNDTNKADGAYYTDKVLSGDGQTTAHHEVSNQTIRYLTDSMLYAAAKPAISVATSGPVDALVDSFTDILTDPVNNRVAAKVMYKNGAKKVSELDLADFSPEFQSAMVRLCREWSKAKKDERKNHIPVGKLDPQIERLFEQINNGSYHRQVVKNARMRYDPSGFVYEAVLSNRVDGATVTLYTHDTAGDEANDMAVQVDSEAFGYEANPQVTGEDGRYQWFVETGFWQVRVTKEGYEPVSTGSSQDYGIGATKDLDGDGTDDASSWWMPVLPTQTDVNIGLVSKAVPEIVDVKSTDDGFLVTFNKYVDVETVTASLFSMGTSSDAKTAADSVEPQNAEDAGDGSKAADGSSPKQLATEFLVPYNSATEAALAQGAGEALLSLSDSEGKVTTYAGETNPITERTFTTEVPKRDLSTASVTVASQTYTGKAQTPAPKVVLGGKTLVAGTDYTVSYANNTDAGTATVTITGIGAYKGSVSKTFSIAKANVSQAAVTLAATSFTYDGKAKTPGVTVKIGGTTLASGTNYTLSYASNVNAGTATVTVTGKGNYTGTKSATFKISPATISSVTLSQTSFAYDGTAKRPGVTVRSGSLTVPASGYTLSYANNTKEGTATATVTGRGNYAGTRSAGFKIAAPHVAYRTHVQNVGWQAYVRDGATAGTSGRALRLEGANIRLEGAPCAGGIEYRTHVQNVGWQAYVRDGAMTGTSGRALRLEAIQIRLTGEMAKKYDVWYRVHSQNLGWMGWARNDAPAGTAGYAYRLEALQVMLLPKGSAAPGQAYGAFQSRTGEMPAQATSGHLAAYRTHVQDQGWQAWVTDGATSGTFGLARRLEGICVSLPDRPCAGSVEYRTHVQNVGWQPYVRDGAMAGTSGRALRLEAIQIRLTGEMAKKYDVWYRVHAQDFGWMGWAKNDARAGTAGYAKRLEAIQILVLPKGSAAPGPTANAFRQR